jgi:hypothetical protein
VKRVVFYEDDQGNLTRAAEPPGQEPGGVMRPLVALGKSPGDCWEWLGRRQDNGYGKKQFNGRTVLAHRWLWIQLFGKIPDGLVIDHVCQNRGCVNPHHLRVVTQAENVRSGLTTLLTEGDVKEIRKLHEAGWFNDNIAAKFNVHVATISSLLVGKSWRKAKPFYGPKKYAPNKVA